MLDGDWEFRRDGQTAWKTVRVPSAMQSHEGTEWHGVGWYRKAVGKVDLPAEKRAFIHFTAAATFAEVFWNGTKVGEHLGGWTPFRFDVTELVRKGGPDATHELTVKLDERVGHNTQGFLPIVQPHFGGIWQSVQLLTLPEKAVADLRVELPTGTELPVWSPKDPKLKEVVVSTESGDRVTVRTAKRTMEVKGNQFLLNGEPLIVRGVLNWGYYPPNLEPNPSPEIWREDLKRIKARGFNLMKCCLWVPPARLLDIADEEGVLIWMEYPTWHPQLTPKHLPDLTREFEEFFAHVRHHPSVILHSLTCETGPSADINVLKALTAKCKEMIPGAVVEDDSSWIEWNRVTDFYDDHPYGNNHTWVKTLHRLRDYKKLGVKPLLLGEAIAADTWTPVGELTKVVGDKRPYWLPYHFDANKKWLETLAAAGAKIDEKQLVEDSKKYAMLMRKYQIETFRREVPTGGYVVSVLRDFPLAAMGLVDYEGKDKWRAEDWNWHGETMLTLRTRDDRRTFARTHIVLAEIIPAGRVFLGAAIDRSAGPFKGAGAKIKLQPEDNSTEPVRLVLPVETTAADKSKVTNEWSLWNIPVPEPNPPDVFVARRLDEALLAKLEAGARVLLLPDGGPGSPPLQSHWFLRGGPAVFDHPALKTVPRDLLVETQHFDLAGDVIPNIGYLAEIDPIFLLWDNHDIREVRTHALAFTTRVGKGRLLVSALKHDGDTNAVGKWLLGKFGKYLADGPDPRNALSPATIAGIRQKLTEQKVELGQKTWKFKPDPKNEGLKLNWHEAATKTADWADIKITGHWEGQGYPTLDGWAWYRLTVDVPKEFAGKDAYLRFTGVDDYYEVFVNGKKVGSGGDIEKKQTAFEEAKSHKITEQINPGEPATIAVRVYDWYGAGGLFRPVTLTTAAGAAGGSAFVK
ncbi:MAG TPA: glycoside hydrolase family 2 TIM barrel-domain containing protein, partial [Gemmataceae bacterium]|nr:glycoside hydrolase family 2 TIM barrel-domain containing protein [Gemmataceae bacterium]